jgi:hypothetical protein
MIGRKNKEGTRRKNQKAEEETKKTIKEKKGRTELMEKENGGSRFQNYTN